MQPITNNANNSLLKALRGLPRANLMHDIVGRMTLSSARQVRETCSELALLLYEGYYRKLFLISPTAPYAELVNLKENERKYKAPQNIKADEALVLQEFISEYPNIAGKMLRHTEKSIVKRKKKLEAIVLKEGDPVKQKRRLEKKLAKKEERLYNKRKCFEDLTDKKSDLEEYLGNIKTELQKIRKRYDKSHARLNRTEPSGAALLTDKQKKHLNRRADREREILKTLERVYQNLDLLSTRKENIKKEIKEKEEILERIYNELTPSDIEKMDSQRKIDLLETDYPFNPEQIEAFACDQDPRVKITLIRSFRVESGFRRLTPERVAAFAVDPNSDIRSALVAMLHPLTEAQRATLAADTQQNVKISMIKSGHPVTEEEIRAFARGTWLMRETLINSSLPLSDQQVSVLAVDTDLAKVLIRSGRSIKPRLIEIFEDDHETVDTLIRATHRPLSPEKVTEFYEQGGPRLIALAGSDRPLSDDEETHNERIKALLFHKDPLVRQAVLKRRLIPEHIELAAAHWDDSVKLGLIRRGHITNEHLTDILLNNSDTNSDVTHTLISHHCPLTQARKDLLIQNGSVDTTCLLIKHQYDFTPEQIADFAKGPPEVQIALINSHLNLTPEQIADFVKGPPEVQIALINSHRNLNFEQIEFLAAVEPDTNFSDAQLEVKIALINSDYDLTDERIYAFSKSVEKLQIALIKSGRHLDARLIETFSKGPEAVQLALMESGRHLDTGPIENLGKGPEAVQRALINSQHPVDKEFLDTFMEVSYYNKYFVIASRRDLTYGQLIKLAADNDDRVIYCLREYRADQLEKFGIEFPDESSDPQSDDASE